MTSLRVQTKYTEIVSELTFHRLASFLLKMISRVPVCGRALLEDAIRYHNSVFNRVNSALQRGTDISKSETLAKWSVFLDTVAYIYIYIYLLGSR